MMLMLMMMTMVKERKQCSLEWKDGRSGALWNKRSCQNFLPEQTTCNPFIAYFIMGCATKDHLHTLTLTRSLARTHTLSHNCGSTDLLPMSTAFAIWHKELKSAAFNMVRIHATLPSTDIWQVIFQTFCQWMSMKDTCRYNSFTKCDDTQIQY